MALFRAIQVETPTPLGPPDGRYLMRPTEDAEASHVLVFRGAKNTIISVEEPLVDAAAGAEWVRTAGEEDLSDYLVALVHAIHSFRLVIADPHLHPPSRRQLLVARVGYGEGEALADSLLAESRELPAPKQKSRFFNKRSKVLEPQAKLAAALGRREPPLISQELALRAQLDVEYGRWREAALQLLVTLDATIAELSLDRSADNLAVRINELRDQRAIVNDAAQEALAGPISEEHRAAVAHTLRRIEASFRARAVANA